MKFSTKSSQKLRTNNYLRLANNSTLLYHLNQMWNEKLLPLFPLTNASPFSKQNMTICKMNTRDRRLWRRNPNTRFWRIALDVTLYCCHCLRIKCKSTVWLMILLFFLTMNAKLLTDWDNRIVHLVFSCG